MFWGKKAKTNRAEPLGHVVSSRRGDESRGATSGRPWPVTVQVEASPRHHWWWRPPALRRLEIAHEYEQVTTLIPNLYPIHERVHTSPTHFKWVHPYPVHLSWVWIWVTGIGTQQDRGRKKKYAHWKLKSPVIKNLATWILMPHFLARAVG